jgi:glycine cleavage system H lipoate-binding protein
MHQFKTLLNYGQAFVRISVGKLVAQVHAPVEGV